MINARAPIRAATRTLNLAGWRFDGATAALAADRRAQA
jgi:hypothetical protein